MSDGWVPRSRSFNTCCLPTTPTKARLPGQPSHPLTWGRGPYRCSNTSSVRPRWLGLSDGPLQQRSSGAAPRTGPRHLVAFSCVALCDGAREETCTPMDSSRAATSGNGRPVERGPCPWAAAYAVGAPAIAGWRAARTSPAIPDFSASLYAEMPRGSTCLLAAISGGRTLSPRCS